MYRIAEPALQLDSRGVPHSGAFSDSYFYPGDGLAETRYVYLQGVGLEQELLQSQQDAVCIAELGFGTGLNFLATLKAWRRAGRRQPLDYVAVEGFPLSRAQLAEALRVWRDDLGAEIEDLLDAYPPTTPGFHLCCLDGGRVRLLLLFGEVMQVLPQAQFAAQAWYLDGFAPDRNPEMWQPQVFAEIRRLSQEGARFASFSAARLVKDGLRSIGATLDLRQGFGHKRNCLAARLPGQQRCAAARKSYLVRGGGIGASCLAQTLKAQGQEVAISLEGQLRLGGFGSSNPVGLIEPRMSHAFAPDIELIRLSYIYATQFYDRLDAWVGPRGMEKQAQDAATAQRFAKWLAADLLPADWMQAVGENPLHIDRLWFPQAGAITPTAALLALTQGIALLPQADAADAQVLALGPASLGVYPALQGLLSASRGQLLALRQPPGALPRCISRSGYVASDRAGRWIAGASFQRWPDAQIADHDRWSGEDEAETQQVRQRLYQIEMEQLAGVPINAWQFERAALRAVSKDRSPLVGSIPAPKEMQDCDSLWLFTGFGSRGLVLAPLLAQQLTSIMLNRMWVLPRDIVACVLPARFSALTAQL